MGKFIDEMRNELKEYFETNIKPLIQIENKNTFDKFYSLLLNKFGVKYSFDVRWYENTIRVSAYNKAYSIQFFMTSTIPGTDPYIFNGPAPAINE